MTHVISEHPYGRPELAEDKLTIDVANPLNCPVLVRVEVLLVESRGVEMEGEALPLAAFTVKEELEILPVPLTDGDATPLAGFSVKEGLGIEFLIVPLLEVEVLLLAEAPVNDRLEIPPELDDVDWIVEEVDDGLVEEKLEVIKELFVKCRKLLELEDEDAVPVAGAPVKEGLSMLLLLPLIEEVYTLDWESDMPGHVGRTHVENALGPLSVDVESLFVQVLGSASELIGIKRVLMDTGHIDKSVK